MLQASRSFESDRETADLDGSIAIVGMACRFAGARSVAEYWANIAAGVRSIRDYTDEELIARGISPGLLAGNDYVKAGAPIEDMECFDARLFGLSPRDAAIMDPQHRHFLECAWEALEDAGHTPERFDGAIGVFAGTGHNAYMPYNLLTNPKLVRDVGLFLLRHTGNDKDFLATRLSYLLDLQGPSVNVQTACSTSLVAIHMASQSLLAGECDLALAGAASIELPHGLGYRFEPGGILSPDGHCRAFDADSQGTVFGSGVGVVLLRRLADAIDAGDHIHAVIRSSAVNNDGASKVGYLAPSITGQARCVAEALSIAEVDPRSIGYVEAHGTGTALGDPIEFAALAQVFTGYTDDSGFCAIGSVKGNIGHTDTAAGVASLIKTAMALQHRTLPPLIGFRDHNPACRFEASPFYVNTEAKPWPADIAPRRAGVSSLGVGGTNAHVILQEAPETGPSGPSRRHQLLTLSAATPEVLDANAAALAAHFLAHPEADLADAAYTLAVGRKALGHRRTIVATSTAQAAERLPTEGTTAAIADRPVQFMFSGAGGQHPRMAGDLYETEPVFRETIDTCCALLAAQGRADVRRWLLPRDADLAEAAEALKRPSIGLPALFAVQVGLARLWMSHGITPAGMIGHSAGEIATAHIAGVFDLPDALRLAAARGELFEQVSGGTMLSVPLSEADLLPLLPNGVTIAVVNAPRMSVASGPAAAIEQLKRTLEERDVESRIVPIAVAAHSAMLDPILPRLNAVLRSLKLRAPTIPFVSNLSGTWIKPDEATDPEYWVRHTRETVRFGDGLAQLFERQDCALLEIGPGQMLAQTARQHPGRTPSHLIVPSLGGATDNRAGSEQLLATFGHLWAGGVPVDPATLWDGETRRRVPLPTYRFERKRHWIEPGAAQFAGSVDEDEPEREADVARWLYQPSWTRIPLEPADGQPGSGPALVFLDKLGLGQALTARLRGKGREVVTVRAGQLYRETSDGFVLRRAEREHYERMIQALADQGRLPGEIYHCWLVTGKTRRATSARGAARMLERGFYSLMELARALGAEASEHPVQFTLVTNEAQRIAENGPVIAAKTAAAAALKVIEREQPNVRARAVDVCLPARSDAAAELERLARQVIGETRAQEHAECVAYRGTERWVQTFARCAPEAADPDSTALQQGGVYMITGGMGGLGFTLARHLGLTYQARLVLLARTAFPPRARWAELLATLPCGDPVARSISAMLAMEEAGAEVLVLTADVSSPASLRRAVAQASRRFGRIDGVFHAAGVLDDKPLALKSEEEAGAVLAPKVFGTLAIERAFHAQPPAFIALFSSVSAVAGLPGQFDYAAANAFLDGFAQAHAGQTRPRVMSIGWSRWREVGMAAGPGRSSGADLPDSALSVGSPLGHPLLRAHHELSPDEHLFTGSLSPESDWVLDEHRLRSGGPLLPGTAYLELARAAADVVAGCPITLSDIAFAQPFAVAPGTERCLRVHLERRGEAWRFAVLGRPAEASADARWTEHARGTIECDVGAVPEPLPIEAIAARCADDRMLPGTLADAPHLRFGARWETVRSARHGEREALLELALPAAYRAEVEALGLHPALLDFATAGGQRLISRFDPSRDLFVPASYGRVELFASLPAQVRSHIRLLRDPAEDQEFATFEVTLAGLDGKVVARVEEFTMVRVPDPDRLVLDDGAAPSAAIVADDAAGILPEEGLRVMERLLAGDGPPHTLISPMPLMPAIAALRAPARKIAARQQDGADNAPATPTEQVIADLWADLLGIPSCGRDDDFFDLGGHSLLAVQFVNRLRKKTGRTMPLSAMVDAPTVRRLAALLSPDEAQDGATPCEDGPSAPAGVIPIRAGHEAQQLFLIHDGLGETLLYRGLALLLRPGRAVFGLEPERLPDGQAVHTSIGTMAAAHVRRMRQVQPDGPYLLGGLCAGGVIAFEMARQLQDAGERVSFLGLIDAADVEAAKQPFSATRARYKRMAQSIQGVGIFSPAMLRTLVGKASALVRWELGTRLERQRRRVSIKRIEAGEHAAQAPVSFLHVYEEAHRNHRPQGLFTGGQVVLFRATNGDGSLEDVPYRDQYSDAVLGWGKRVADEIHVVDVPGGHSSALQEPNVKVLAAALQDGLDAASKASCAAESEAHLQASPASAERILEVADA